MASAFDRIMDRLTGHIAEQAGVSVAKSPAVQAAMVQARTEFDKASAALGVAELAGILIFLFYFVPRFEIPIPRPLRSKR